MNALDLARLQFALTAGFHFLFVTLTLGLAPLLVFFQTRYTVTGKSVHREQTRFWGRLYLINYGMGIITGLVMEFQFGLDWNGLSRFAGNVFGAPLALESLLAFFLESTFLGMWIFGWDRMPKLAHLALIYLVTLTAFGSAFWIMVANGFLQHPVGGVVHGGVFVLTDFSALLNNNEALLGLTHLLGGTFLAGSLVVAGVSAWQLRHGTAHHVLFLSSLRVGVAVAPVAATLAIHQGFAQFDYLGVDQPGKLARAFGTRLPMHTPLPPSWLDIPANVMQYGGFLVGILTVAGLLLLAVSPSRLRWLLWLLTAAIPLPFVFVLCGWLVREEGRQPWVVFGKLRTADAASGSGIGSVLASFLVFVGILLTLAVVDYVLLRRAAVRGPDPFVGQGMPAEPEAVIL